MEINNLIINNKEIFIFEHHHHAIVHWYKISNSLNKKPALLTFDYHTDTKLAFLQHNYKKLNGAEHSRLINEANLMTSSIDTMSDVVNVVDKLKNDEHIDFAIRAGIISHAYVISNNTSNPVKSEELKKWEIENKNIIKIYTGQQATKPIKHTYSMPINSILEFDNEHFSEWNIYDERERANLAIDDKNLDYRLKKIKEVNNSIFWNEYDFLDNFILDIDLDYFNTIESVKPKKLNLFYELIRKAKVITIAKESYFVNKCKLDDKLTVAYLREELLKHISLALKYN